MTPHDTNGQSRAIGDRRCALVTGAASGLGRALAVKLAQRGWRIALADIDEAGCRTTLEQVVAAGGDGRYEPLDVASSDQWQTLHDRLTAIWPELDLLVNNAGVACSGDVEELSLDDWRWLLDINLHGMIYGCHTFLAWLKRNPRGAHIVNVASVAAVVSAPSMGAYNVSKAGILSLSETLHNELQPHGVGVTVVCPGFFRTNIVDAGRFRCEKQRSAATTLMNRSKVSADYVADRILRAVERKQLYLFMPAAAKAFWRAKRIAPRFVLRLVGWIARRRAVPASPVQLDHSRGPSTSALETEGKR